MSHADVVLRQDVDGWQNLFTAEWYAFFTKLLGQFEDQCRKIFVVRRLERQNFYEKRTNAGFDEKLVGVEDKDWTVDPLPKILTQRPTIILGDVDSSQTAQFTAAFDCPSATAVQVDMDDACCPSWVNVVNGHVNMKDMAQKLLIEGRTHPMLIFRPRSWNLVDLNVRLRDKAVFAPLVDFSLWAIHTARPLYQLYGCIPIQLPKLESGEEASVWESVFCLAESELGLQSGCIKATLIVESLPLIYQLEEALFALRKHAAGLNCGVWDYIASMGARCFPNSKNKITADSKVLPTKVQMHVNTNFLTAYRRRIARVCHRRGCVSTAGMIAALPPQDPEEKEQWSARVTKSHEVIASEGFYGCLTYDASLVVPLVQLFIRFASSSSQTAEQGSMQEEVELTSLPQATPTLECIETIHAYTATVVGIIAAWRHGYGHFFFKESVEDCATVEISRIWLWQRLAAKDDAQLHEHVRTGLAVDHCFCVGHDKRSLRASHQDTLIALKLLKAETLPPFLSTWLQDQILSQHTTAPTELQQSSRVPEDL